MYDLVWRIGICANDSTQVNVFCKCGRKREACARRILPSIEGVTCWHVYTRLFERGAIVNYAILIFAINCNTSFYAIKQSVFGVKINHVNAIICLRTTYEWATKGHYCQYD